MNFLNFELLLCNDGVRSAVCVQFRPVSPHWKVVVCRNVKLLMEILSLAHVTGVPIFEQKGPRLNSYGPVEISDRRHFFATVIDNDMLVRWLVGV